MTLTIGALAQATGVYVGAIRYYQRLGLISQPLQSSRGVRQYSDDHARRLVFIKHAKALGFGLDDIASLLALEDGLPGRDAGAIGAKQLATVRERITQLRRIEGVLAFLIEQRHHGSAVVHCALIEALERTEIANCT